MAVPQFTWITVGLGLGTALLIPYFLGLSDAQIKQWTLTISYVGFIVTVVKALQDWGDAIEQRKAEQKWKKSELAMKVMDAMDADVMATHATRMLDWTGRDYMAPSGKTFNVTYEAVATALRPHEDATDPDGIAHFTSEEAFIRDCFDRLLDHLDRIGHLVEIQLIEFEDIKGRLDYWARLLVKGKAAKNDACRRFMATYGFDKALALVNRLAKGPG